jgi:hypothetical protein
MLIIIFSITKTYAQNNILYFNTYNIFKAGKTPLISPNGRYKLILQEDYNLVLYDRNTPKWTSNTYNVPGAYAKFSDNGNLVIYNPRPDVILSTNLLENIGKKLELNDDGNLIIYNSKDEIIWTIKKINGEYIDNGTLINHRSIRYPGEQLSEGTFLTSPDGKNRFTIQKDGNVVLTFNYNINLWASNTENNSNMKVEFTKNGNLVIKNGEREMLSTALKDNKGGSLQLDNNRNLIIYNNKGQKIWSIYDYYGNACLRSGTLFNARSALKGKNILQAGEQLKEGLLISPNGRYRFIYHKFNFISLYDSTANVFLWRSKFFKNAEFSMDGNLTIIGEDGEQVSTEVTGGNTLELQDDGNLLIFDKKHQPIWAIKEKDGSYKMGGELNAPTYKNTLKPGERLKLDYPLVSSNGVYKLVNHINTLNIFVNDEKVWSTAYLEVQGNIGFFNAHSTEFSADGNFKINGYNKIVSTTIANEAGKKLVLEDDGNLVIYDSDNKSIWSLKDKDGKYKSFDKFIPYKNVLKPKEKLERCIPLCSPNGVYKLVQLQDNNVVFYKNDEVKWMSNTNGKPNLYVQFTFEGNLIIDDGANVISTELPKLFEPVLGIQDDGNLTINGMIYSNTGNHGYVAQRWAIRGDKYNYIENGKLDNKPQKPRYTNTLKKGERFVMGYPLTSSNGIYTFIQGEKSRDIVLYEKNTPKWKYTFGRDESDKSVLEFTLEGELQIISVEKSKEYSIKADIKGKGGTSLTLQDDGNLVIYDDNNKVVWSLKYPNTNVYIPNNLLKVAYTDILNAGQKLEINTPLISNNGIYKFIQENYDVILYENNIPKWKSKDSVTIDNIQYIAFTADGDLEIKNTGASPFTIGCGGLGGKTLVMQDDGNLVIYDAKNRPVWTIKSIAGNYSSNGRLKGTKYKLKAGDKLTKGVVLPSPNGVYKFVLRVDGNIALYENNTAKWTYTSFGGLTTVELTTEGDLVIKDADDTIAAGVKGGKTLSLENDGNLIIQDSNDKVIWSIKDANGNYKPEGKLKD